MKKQTHSELFKELMTQRCHGNLSLNCDEQPVTALMADYGYIPVCEEHLRKMVTA